MLTAKLNCIRLFELVNFKEPSRLVFLWQNNYRSRTRVWKVKSENNNTVNGFETPYEEEKIINQLGIVPYEPTRKRGDYLFPKADPPHDDHWHDESGPITQYQRPWLCQRRYFSQPASASRDSPHIYRQNLSYVGLQVCVTLDYAHRY